MIKVILQIFLLTFTTACSKSNDEDTPKKGVIEYGPKVVIDKNTRINLHFTEIRSQSLDTAQHFGASISDSLQKHLGIVKQKGNYKGLSIAIGIPGCGFWKSTIGESGTELPLTTETQFHAMSLGKIFTSALLLKLMEDGYLDIHDTISKWFPDCPGANEITINHLLDHTSGIQTYDALYEFVTLDKNRFAEEEMLDMAFQYQIGSIPGTYISYTNTGYIMLGIIIQRVTGKSLKDCFNDYLIRPLGLKNTVYCNQDNLMMGNIRGFEGNAISGVDQWPLTYAAGPFISTPTDIIMLFNYLLSGQFNGETSMNLMISEMNIWKYKPDTYYGKGIYVIKDLPSGNYLGHGGGHGNFRTCIFYNIEKKIFVSLFSNTRASEIEPAMFYMSEQAMRLSYMLGR